MDQNEHEQFIRAIRKCALLGLTGNVNPRSACAAIIELTSEVLGDREDPTP